MFCVYILKSLKNGRLYTGSTDDLERRLDEHNKKQSKYTSYTGPYSLVYSEEYLTRDEAVKRELFLKTGKGRDFLKEIIKMRR